MARSGPASSRNITRRDALKLLGVGTVGAAGSAAIGCSSTPSAEAKKVDVVVVGAGFAGMVAARELLHKGKSVVVLEARDRVGGRVKAGKIAGQTVDVGGMWVGPTQTKLLSLIKEFGLHTTPQYIVGNNVEQLPASIWQAPGEDLGLDPAAQKEFDALVEQLDKLSAQVPLETPWTSPRADEFDHITAWDWLLTNTKHESVRTLMRAILRVVWQAEPFQVSLLFLLFYIRSGGTAESLFGVKDAAQAFRIVEGMHGVAEKLASGLGEAIVFNSPVRSIAQNSTGVIVRSDKSEWHANRTIVSVPLPLSARIAYDPPLSPERDALAQHMPMGSVIKWYVAYEKPFWRDRGLSGFANSAVPPISVTYDATHAEGKPGLLVGFIDSTAVLQWTSRSVADRKKLVVDRLVQLFGLEAANPIDYEDQNWPAEEWSRGCYGASMGPGVMTSVGKSIREPHGRIHWAGTETATIWMGYVDGAIRSGERAAAEVLAKL